MDEGFLKGTGALPKTNNSHEKEHPMRLVLIKTTCRLSCVESLKASNITLNLPFADGLK